MAAVERTKTLGYRLEHDETLGDGVRRVAIERLDDALATLDDPGSNGSIEEAVHDVRKRCKELRGLVRLVRPALGDRYRTTNHALRDAARELSPLRDAHALLATFDHVVAGYVERIPPEGLAGVRAGLVAEAEAATSAVDGGDPRLAEARTLLAHVKDQAPDWSIDDDVDVVASGAATTYRRARKAMRAAGEEPSDEHLHEWRKRIKYLWYQMRLVESAAPSVLEPLVARLHDLADGLGDDHDLAVLVATTSTAPDDHGGREQVERLHDLLGEVRADLQHRCRLLGERLLAEPPKAFAARISAYLEAWRRVGDERNVGEIESLAPADDELTELDDEAVAHLAEAADVTGVERLDRTELEAAVRASGVVRR